MNRVLVMIMAGGAGERLQPLTKDRSKGAVPFGGKFRLVDLTLSNCINSGLRRIYVLTQYLSESLNRHVQEGWAISSAGLGDYIYCIPAQQKHGAAWYLGTADAVRQNLDLINSKDVDHVLILSSDHIYKMNYRQLLAYHCRKKASLTISAIRVKKERAAGKLGTIETDAAHRLIGFEEKSAHPKTLPDATDCVLASMGVYLFKVDALLQALKISGHDFGREIIPGMMGRRDDIFVYDYEKENRIEELEVYSERRHSGETAGRENLRFHVLEGCWQHRLVLRRQPGAGGGGSPFQPLWGKVAVPHPSAIHAPKQVHPGRKNLGFHRM